MDISNFVRRFVPPKKEKIEMEPAVCDGINRNIVSILSSPRSRKLLFFLREEERRGLDAAANQ